MPASRRPPSGRRRRSGGPEVQALRPKRGGVCAGSGDGAGKATGASDGLRDTQNESWNCGLPGALAYAYVDEALAIHVPVSALGDRRWTLIPMSVA